MRVLLDAYWWSKGPTSNRMVQREIIKEWLYTFPEDELIVAIPSGHDAADVPAGISVLRTKGRYQLLINSIELPILARRIGDVDCIFTHNFASCSRRSLVFIHDFIFSDHPEWFSAGERLYFSFMPVLAKRARSIILSTRTEEVRVRRILRTSARTTVSGLAVSREMASIPSCQPQQLQVEPGRFLLVVGRLDIRKNLNNTIRGVLASGVASPQFPLVIVGEGRGDRVLSELRLEELVESRVVRFAGFLPNAELKWMYESAALCLFISLDEGYGLPPVEALSFGGTVLVSDISVFRETMSGSGAKYVDPCDIGEIARAVRRMAFSRRDCTPLARKSNTPFGRFDWGAVVRTIRDEAQIVSSDCRDVRPSRREKGRGIDR